jgi:hypothetical protein
MMIPESIIFPPLFAPFKVVADDATPPPIACKRSAPTSAVKNTIGSVMMTGDN